MAEVKGMIDKLLTNIKTEPQDVDENENVFGEGCRDADNQSPDYSLEASSSSELERVIENRINVAMTSNPFPPIPHVPERRDPVMNISSFPQLPYVPEIRVSNNLIASDIGLQQQLTETRIKRDPRMQRRSDSVYEQTRQSFTQNESAVFNPSNQQTSTNSRLNAIAMRVDRGRSLLGREIESYYVSNPPFKNESQREATDSTSPLIRSAHNMRFRTQSDSVRYLPYKSIPPSVQQAAHTLGANFDAIFPKLKPVSRNRSPPPVPVQRQNDSLHVEKKDNSTQTTKNTGGLRLDLSAEELASMTLEQKRIILELKKAFPQVSDERGTADILERLEHRKASIRSTVTPKREPIDYSPF